MAKKMNFAQFEKSGRDVDPKGMKEGSKADKALDKKQMAAGFNKGGKAGHRSSEGGFRNKGMTNRR